MEQREFENIVRRIRSKIVGVAQSYGLTTETAEDIAQDTLLRLWTLRDELDRYRSVEALAVSVARHLCIDHHRRRHIIAVEVRPTIADSHSRPDEELENADNEAWLQKRLNQLPPSEYQILHLRQVEHKSNQDIANILGITVSSVATILSKARHRLLDDIKKRNK